MDNLCKKCKQAVDDHDECPKCHKNHCELEVCPTRMKEEMGQMPDYKPPPCLKCGQPLGTWDTKRECWRPLPQRKVCPHCRASL
jgi:hypothetical protein